MKKILLLLMMATLLLSSCATSTLQNWDRFNRNMEQSVRVLDNSRRSAERVHDFGQKISSRTGTSSSNDVYVASASSKKSRKTSPNTTPINVHPDPNFGLINIAENGGRVAYVEFGTIRLFNLPDRIEIHDALDRDHKKSWIMKNYSGVQTFKTEYSHRNYYQVVIDTRGGRSQVIVKKGTLEVAHYNFN